MFRTEPEQQDCWVELDADVTLLDAVTLSDTLQRAAASPQPRQQVPPDLWALSAEHVRRASALFLLLGGNEGSVSVVQTLCFG